MIKQIFDNLRSIHFETELMEALNWDSDEVKKSLDKLSNYFENIDSTATVSNVKKELDLLFPKNITSIIFKYMDYVSKRMIQEKGSIEYEA